MTYEAFVPDRALAELESTARNELMRHTADALSHVSGAANVPSGFVVARYSIMHSGWIYRVTFGSAAWTGRYPSTALPSFRFGPVRFVGTLDAFTLVIGPVTMIRVGRCCMLEAAGFEFVRVGRAFRIGRK